MTEHDYEATIETEHGTFTFSGDNAQAVSAQVARMPVMMHNNQVERGIDLGLPVFRYIEEIAKQQEEAMKSPRDFGGYERRHDRD